MKFPKEVEYGNIEYKLKITTNENNEDLILLSIQYQFLNG